MFVGPFLTQAHGSGHTLGLQGHQKTGSLDTDLTRPTFQQSHRSAFLAPCIRFLFMSTSLSENTKACFKNLYKIHFTQNSQAIKSQQMYKFEFFSTPCTPLFSPQQLPSHTHYLLLPLLFHVRDIVVHAHMTADGLSKKILYNRIDVLLWVGFM